MAASDTTDSSVLALATLDDTRQMENNLICVASPHAAKARKGGRMEQRALKKCKQLIEYRHLPLLTYILIIYFLFFKHQCFLIHLWQLKMAVFQHKCLKRSLLLRGRITEVFDKNFADVNDPYVVTIAL